MNYPDNLLDVIDHERFHHTEKGCDMELRIHKSLRGDIAEEYFCKTHNVLCSKTGWQLGWYLGNKSDYKHSLQVYYCKTCGIKIESKSARMFCSVCKKKKMAENFKRFYKKNEEKRLEEKRKRKEERDKRRRIINQQRKLSLKGIKGKKLDELLGFMSEYIKTGDEHYEDRIGDYEYNELVKKADELVVKFLNKKYNKTTNNFNL